MPNIKSAKKRVLINEKKNLHNRMALSTMKTAIRKVNDAIATNNIALAEELLPGTFSIIDKTASKGVIHVNKAANHKSTLAKLVHEVKTGQRIIAIKKTNEQIAAEKAKAAKEVRDAQNAERAKKRAEKEAAKEQAAKDAKGKKKTSVKEVKDDKKADTKKTAAKPAKTDAKKADTKVVEAKTEKKTEAKKETKAKDDKKTETKEAKPKKEEKAKEAKPKKDDKKTEKPKK